MEPTKPDARHARRARLAGWLLIAGSAVAFAVPQVPIFLVALDEGPHYLSFLMASVPLALVVCVPVALVGLFVLKGVPMARWIGIGIALVAMLVVGQLLVADVGRTSSQLYWPTVGAYIAVWVALLAMSVIVVLALATAGGFFSTEDPDISAPTEDVSTEDRWTLAGTPGQRR